MNSRDLKKSAEDNRLLEIKELERQHHRANFQDALFVILSVVSGIALLILTR